MGIILVISHTLDQPLWDYNKEQSTDSISKTEMRLKKKLFKSTPVQTDHF